MCGSAHGEPGGRVSTFLIPISLVGVLHTFLFRHGDNEASASIPPSSTVAGAKPGKSESHSGMEDNIQPHIFSSLDFQFALCSTLIHLWAYTSSGVYDGSHAFELADSFEGIFHV